MINRFVLIAVLCGIVSPSFAQDFTREIAAAEALRKICTADHGRLWGADLCGPFIVVDPSSRTAWANQADGEGVLHRQDDGWVGVLPADVGVANTSVEWAGVRWIMVLRPSLSDDETELAVLVAHEAWHRIQASIGLAAQSSECAHLESQRGRYLLRLELRALGVAMTSRGGARWRAARDALTFRAARLKEFPGAADEEAALDRNEGLASYTGVKLGAGGKAFDFAARTLASFDNHDAYARSYAYASGPAYGLLLDKRAGKWRKNLTAGAPADLLAQAIKVSPANDLADAETRYDGATIASEEQARAEIHRALIAELRARYANGPRLEMPLAQIQIQFDPNTLTPVEDLGVVYGVLTLRDAWGQLNAQEGALISSDFSLAIAAAPAADGLSGPGWTLALNPGYRVSPADDHGVRRVEPAKKAR